METCVHSFGSYRSHLRKERAEKLARWRSNAGAAWIAFEIVVLIFFGGMACGQFIS